MAPRSHRRRVFTTPRRSLLRLAVRRACAGPAGVAPGLLDTDPFRVTLGDMLADEHFGSGVAARRRLVLDTVAIAASSCAVDGAVVFLQRDPAGCRCRGPGVAYAPSRTRARPSHGLIGLPAWPSRRSGSVGPHRAGTSDGGVHLNTPLKPAVDLGADRILVIGATPWDIDQPASPSLSPNVMDGGGQILHALLVDSLRADLAALALINENLNDGAEAGPTPLPAVGDQSDAGQGIGGGGSSAPSRRSTTVSVTSPPRAWPSGVLPFVRSLGGYGALGTVMAQRLRPDSS